MDQWALDRLYEWDSKPFEGGVEGLHSLADDAFTGVVEANGTYVYYLNGRVVGRDGSDLTDIGDDGTVYHAPDPSLPLLFEMRRAGGREEGQYYTEDTSLRSVHQTLEDGGFTGYLELSENVLSGDYFIIYYGGRALPVAFVGASHRCLTGSEALQKAADEVGIFEVYSVDIEVESLPAPPAEVGAEATDGQTASSSVEADASTAVDEETEPEPSSAEPANEPETEEADQPEEDPPTEPDESEQATESAPESNHWDVAPDRRERPNTDGELRTKAVPSVDPDRTNVGAMQPPSDPEPEPESAPTAEEATEEEPNEDEEPDIDPEIVDELEAERDALQEERDTLAERVQELEAELEQLEDELAETDDPDALAPDEPTQTTETTTGMAPEEALAASHLFVRYETRGGATLESAVETGESREDVRENLMLERHTAFDDATVDVEGQPYREFIEDRLEVRFTRWLLEELLFEIDETNSRNALADLVDTFARIDRIDFHEAIEGVEDYRFDVVARDRLGNPVLAADVDPGRTPSGQDRITDLIEASSEVAASYAHFGASMLVTESYFEPETLAVAEEATGDSLLSRSEKQSYVKVARGVGFHLCMIECRDESFHMTTPTL